MFTLESLFVIDSILRKFSDFVVQILFSLLSDFVEDSVHHSYKKRTWFDGFVMKWLPQLFSEMFSSSIQTRVLYITLPCRRSWNLLAVGTSAEWVGVGEWWLNTHQESRTLHDRTQQNYYTTTTREPGWWELCCCVQALWRPFPTLLLPQSYSLRQLQ